MRPGITIFPGQIDTNKSLLDARDNCSTKLMQSVAIDSTSIIVADTTNFADAGVITLHNRSFSLHEKIYYESKTRTTFDDLTRPDPLLVDLSCPDIYVSALDSEDYHNVLKDAIIEIEKYLGVDTTGLLEIIIDPDTGLAKFRDPTRSNKWVSTDRQTFSFGRNRTNLGDQYLRFVDRLVTSVNGPPMVRNALITAISLRCTNNVNADFHVRRNGVGIDLTTVSLSGTKDIQVDNLNVDLNAGDYLQIYMDVNSGTVSRPVINVEFAWRF